jgi:AraC-like DNA-binding protein
MNDFPPFEKLMELFKVLQCLASTTNYELLHAESATIEVKSNDYTRINQINCFVADNYHQSIHLSELAQLTGLTETSFSRFFKKVTNKTFITFLNEYRVQKACNLLANKNTSIADVMEQSGFVEPAHFTRIFKRYTNFSPRDYRKRIRNW